MIPTCLFCEKELRIDQRSGKAFRIKKRKVGVMVCYCDNCGLVWRFEYSGIYNPKKSIIVSTGKGPFRANFGI